MTVGDVILIAAVIFLSIGIIVKAKLFQATQTGPSTEAIVYCDGRALQRLNLLEDTEVVSPDGTMVMVVEDGKIRVKQSNCHRQMCVHAGWVRFSGESIVCVPNKTVIEVSAGALPVVDAVVF